MKKILIEKDSYHDSVFLMLINSELKKAPGVREAVVSMGTEVNTQLLLQIGFGSEELDTATPNDLIIAVEAEDNKALEQAFGLVRELFAKKKSRQQAEQVYHPVSLGTALGMSPKANLLIISVPGRYAAREVRQALQRGLHVMLFSDNVSLEQEISLKKLAMEKGLLMMGPDCGTAVINGKPLCFANVLQRGKIGLVAASGTGLQEVSCGIDKLGQGVSQAIGTGGRDLSPEVGGVMMLMGIEALKRDRQTEVIVVISKPPAEPVAKKVIEKLVSAEKPCVVHFIGLHGQQTSVASSPEAQASSPGKTSSSVVYAGNLEEAAGMAVTLLSGKQYQRHAFTFPEEEVRSLVRKETAGMSKNQRYLRGLFTGGTLADEALILFERELGRTYSNIQTRPELLLQDPHRSIKNTIVDLGEDLFTQGRPHPMIDPSTRVERIEMEMRDSEVALLLLDCVLGYGSHDDPAGAMAEAIVRAKREAESRYGYLSVVASVTGTKADFQNLEAQKRTLQEAGCVVMPSNHQAALLALEIVKEVEGL
jgi:succinyl-CoA synthetase alpha subunit